uniref:Uncharacterized protein n=1 Tax=Oryza brachyantha TaxID=4533 RepID=J3L735_ORYBR
FHFLTSSLSPCSHLLLAVEVNSAPLPPPPPPLLHPSPALLSLASSFFHGRKGWGDDAHEAIHFDPCHPGPIYILVGTHLQSLLAAAAAAVRSLPLPLPLLLPPLISLLLPAKLLLCFRCFFSTPLLFPHFCLLCHAHEKLLPLPSRTLSPGSPPS